MTVTIVGSQLGDEGKGALVDLWGGGADAVARYQGGDNAGHTVVEGGDEYKLSLVPSGAVRGTVGVLGNGCVVNPRTLFEEIDGLRDRGVDLPIEIGIPGVMKYEKLLKISRKVGVGDSVKFLRKTTGLVGFVKQFVGSRGRYRPDDLIDGLGPYVGDDTYNIRGVHIYTFNQTPDLEAWRRSRLEG